jgi:hypothetical protein
MENLPQDAVERLKAVRRSCPGMGLILAKQLLIKNNWFVPFSIEEAWTQFRGDWPVGIPVQK